MNRWCWAAFQALSNIIEQYWRATGCWFHHTTGLDWAPPDTVQVITKAVFTANHLTVTDKQTIRKKTPYKSQKYTHKHNTNQRKQTTKHTAETKLPWFSRLLRHSARKRGGLILQWPRAPQGPSTTQRRHHEKQHTPYHSLNKTDYCIHWLNRWTQ